MPNYNSNTQVAGVITFKYVVHSYFNEKNIFRIPPNQFSRILNIALEGFIDLNMYHVNNVKVAYLQPTRRGVFDPFIIDLPGDFIRHTKIGVPMGGSIRTLTVNKELIMGDTASCNVMEALDRQGKVSKQASVQQKRNPAHGHRYYYVDHYKDGNLVEGMYSMGGGYNDSYYRINHVNRTMTITNKLSTDYVILEYKSTGVDPCQDTAIPRQALEALKAYIDWRVTENDDTKGGAQKQRKHELYFLAIEKLRSFESSFTMDELMDALSETWMQAPVR